MPKRRNPAMHYCSVLCDLIFFIIIIGTMTGPASAVTLVTAKLNQSVTLPCERKCFGLGQWTMSHKPHDLVAECDQMLCSSQEGFKIPYDQYLQGDLTLLISAVDYSKRTTYTCRCDGKDVGHVRLSIEPLISPVHKRPGEDLLLDLSISDPAELIYNRRESEGSSGHQICMVEESVLRCNSEYNQRASLNHTVINLREVKPTDSGVYIIQDVQYKDIIHMYTVTVEEEKPTIAPGDKSSAPLWSIGVIVPLVLLVVLLLIAVGVIWWKNKNLGRNQESKSREWSERTKQSGLKTEEETAFVQDPDGTARTVTNGERVQKLNSSVSVEDHQGSGGSEWRSRLRTSYSCGYLSELVNYILELDALVERHSSGAATGHICSNGDCTVEIEQLRRNIDKFEQQRLSANSTGMMEQLRNERDRLDKIEECCRKRKEELDSLMQQHGKGPTKGHKRGNSEDCTHVFSSVE